MSYYGPGEPAQPGYPHASIDLGYPQPVPAPDSAGSKALLAVLVTVLTLVLCGGGVGALYLIGAGSNPPGGTGTTTGTQSASAAFDPKSVTQGQCLAIGGPTEAPEITPAGCDAGHYQVLRRINGTSDDKQCNAVTGAKFAYHYQTTPDTDSFVLCLKRL